MTTLTTISDVKFITAYGPKVQQKTYLVGPSLTKQSHKDECDINKILARFKRTGTLDFTNKHEPQYGDVTALDFQEAQFLIAKANGMFAAMPAHLRSEFDNSPAKFLAFVNDPTNRLKAEKLGLLKPAPEAAPAPEPAPAPAPAPTPTATA